MADSGELTTKRPEGSEEGRRSVQSEHAGDEVVAVETGSVGNAGRADDT